MLLHRFVLILAAAVAVTRAAEVPSEAQKREIDAKTAELGKRIQALEGKHADPGLIADVEVYRKAAQWIVRFNEFYTKAHIANTLTVLDSGLARAAELEAAKPEWPSRNGRVVRAYRSRIDGSVQPYALVIPDSYRGQPVGSMSFCTAAARR